MLERRTRRYRRLAWATFIAILLMLSLPGHWIEGLKVWIQALLQFPPSGLESWDFPTDKLIHASLFALCAALFVRGWTTFQDRWWLVCLMLFLYGLVTELIQRFVPGRSATLGDLLADGMGVVVGVGMTLLYLRNRPKM